MTEPALAATAAAPAAQSAESLFDLLLTGGPLMVPIGLCSIVALAYSVERWVRLQPRLLGGRGLAGRVAEALEARGVPGGLELVDDGRTPLARILRAGLRRARAPFLEREKAVEDAAASEVKRLGANLRPLLLVYLVAPLLGLLGTVWGMIEAFSNIALQEGLGRPELLAAGIYQALTTTAAGLAIAIPAIVAHQLLRGRIERFARESEDGYLLVSERLAALDPVPAEAKRAGA